MGRNIYGRNGVGDGKREKGKGKGVSQVAQGPRRSARVASGAVWIEACIAARNGFSHRRPADLPCEHEAVAIAGGMEDGAKDGEGDLPSHSRCSSQTHYALVDQIRRAAISVPANIAEGYALGTTSQWVRLNRIALGSAVELKTHLELLRDLELIDRVQLDPVVADATQVIALLVGLLKRLGAKTPGANASPSPPGSA